MSKYFKKGGVLFCAALAAVTLAGCGNSAEDLVQFSNITAAPTANNDNFQALGDATLNQASANGVLTNDAVNGASVSAFDAVGSQGGAIALSQDGSFSYTPVQGFVGTEIFNYTLQNTLGTSSATVTLTSTGRGRFVDNSVGPGGNGTQASPFNTLAAAVAAAQSGDTIFIARGNGTSTGLTGGINLPQGVNLIGEGSGLILAQTIVPAGQAPTVQGPINCLGNNTIRGLTIDGSATDLIRVYSVPDVTVDNCTLLNPTNNHIFSFDASGTLTVTHNSFDRPGAQNMVFIENDEVDVDVIVTDNEFANSANSSFDACTQLVSEGTMSIDVTYSRNRHQGTETNPLRRGFAWDAEEQSGVTANLNCEQNTFTNLLGEAIAAYDVNGMISGNTITDTADRVAVLVSVSDEMLSIVGNTISDAEFGVFCAFNPDTAAGSFIVSNNNITNGSEGGIYFTGTTNITPRVSVRENTVLDTIRSIEISWDQDVDICAEIVGNTVNTNMRFDGDDAGTVNIERRDQLASINTFTNGAVPLLAGNTGDVPEGSCALP